VRRRKGAPPTHGEVNLNAALNAYEPAQLLLDETSCVNAQSTRRLYEQLLAAHPDKARIYVICDNAHYYKNKNLRAWLGCVDS
jgi:hypothetical protein